MSDDKATLRRIIKEKKQTYSRHALREKSVSVLRQLEESPTFAQAHTVLLYHSLPDEVHTHDFIERWHHTKRILLPHVTSRGLILRQYESEHTLVKSPMNIYEPTGKNFTDYEDIDLAIIPGIAFDPQRNRLGRGKGYYDRLLATHPTIPTIGICFDFQLVNEVPTNGNDIAMDMVMAETSAFSQ